MTPQPTRLQQVIVWLVMLVSIRILMVMAVVLVGASFVVSARLQQIAAGQVLHYPGAQDQA